MNTRDALYTHMLHVGLIIVRQALAAGRVEWARAEIDLLHNIPSLIGEKNLSRHVYFWNGERQHYLDWMSRHGTDEAKSGMRTYYMPIWNEMEPMCAPPRSRDCQE